MIFYKIVIVHKDGTYKRSSTYEHEVEEGGMPFDIVEDGVTIIRRSESKEIWAFCQNLDVLKSYVMGFFDAIRNTTNKWDDVKGEKIVIEKDIKQTKGVPMKMDYKQ